MLLAVCQGQPLSANTFQSVPQVLQLAHRLEGRYKLVGMTTSPMALLGLVWIMLKVMRTP